ncbi:MAG: hypothetical protein RR689_01535 [Mucinivorans sp.]
MYEKITQSSALAESVLAIIAQLEDLAKPRLTDLSRLTSLFQIIKDNIDADPACKLNARYYFVPIVLMLYCPRYFMGYPIARGLRDEIALAIGKKYSSTVSQIASSTRNWLTNDRVFREQVDALCEAVISEIKEK